MSRKGPSERPCPSPVAVDQSWGGGLLVPGDIDRAMRERLSDVARRLDVLTHATADLWLNHGPDGAHGGFHGQLDRRWRAEMPTDKGGIQQARHLWTWSMYFERREPSERVRAAAQSCYDWLQNRLFDHEDGEYCESTSRDGATRNRNKTIYCQAFAIYGLSRFASAFSEPAAKQAALDCFEALERRAHDSANGGYDQTGERSWITPGASKETNTHIHVMEALTELYRLSGEPLVGERLSELALACVEKLLQSADYCHLDFHRDWTPLGESVVSYGHDLETTWLLMEAEAALGQLRPEVARGAARMAVHSSIFGFDPKQGGYFDDGYPAGAPRNREKIWWAQFEALSGLWWAYRLTAAPVHIDRLCATLDWIEQNQRDPEFGEWYWGVLPDGSVGSRGAHKGELWKTAYHNLRALVFLRDWLAFAIS